jgi:uncharacterized membrane protein YoaK (UPF0700 family)
MPVTEVVSIILAIIVFVVGVIIALYLSHTGTNLGAEIMKALSFSWLFGGL